MQKHHLFKYCATVYIWKTSFHLAPFDFDEMVGAQSKRANAKYYSIGEESSLRVGRKWCYYGTYQTAKNI